MYGVSFDLTEEQMSKDFVLPIGKAKIMRPGKDITLVAYSRGVEKTLAAAELLAQRGIDAEVINLRSVRPLDRQTIIDSVKKTSRLVTVEDGWPQSGIGAEIISLVNESDAFDFLDAPPMRVTGADVPLPYAPTLEAACLVSADKIVSIVEHVCSRPHKQ